MKILIILIKYAAPEHEQECFHSLIEHTQCPHHVVIYDNFSENRNLGWLWNDTIGKFDDAEYICLLNTDTKVEAGWLTRLVEVLQKNPSAGGRLWWTLASSIPLRPSLASASFSPGACGRKSSSQRTSASTAKR
jgi:GT2 family glycosyltransferase